jgi:hypothetical protein
MVLQLQLPTLTQKADETRIGATVLALTAASEINDATIKLSMANRLAKFKSCDLPETRLTKE